MRRAPAISIAWPDVKGEVGGRNEAEPEFARVQRDRHVAGEKADDLHLAGIVAARHQVVFGPGEIEPDQPRFGPNQRHRGGCLNEDVIRRIVAIDLHDVAEGDAAAGLRRGRVAAQLGSYLADGGRQIVAFRRNAIGEPARFQRRQLGGILRRFADRLREPRTLAPAPRRDHELDVLHVLGLVALELVDGHIDEMRAGYRVEPIEGGEEFVVPAGYGRVA